MSSPHARRSALLSSFLAALCAGLLPPTASAQMEPIPGIDAVGQLKTEAPTETAFLVHGTLPLPRGAWINADVVAPFIVLNHDGWPVLTQTEAVTRYPLHKDGVAVAEVIARVTRPKGSMPGDELTYTVLYVPHIVPAAPPASLYALLNGPIGVPASVKSLVNSPNGFVIEAFDVFGNRYQAAPFADGTMEVLRHGWLQSELRIATTLVPSPAVSGPNGTLPHHLGVHVYVTVSAVDDVIGLDLRFHNGHSGRDKTSALDDALGTVYFQSINLVAPSAWSFVQDYDDPFLGQAVTQPDDTKVFPLVKPNAGGKMHGMTWQSQFHRRLSLAPNAKVAIGRERARGAGLGFSIRGSSPYSGKKLWSWWNKETARWYPQSHVLPNLEFVGDVKLDDTLQKELAFLQTHLENGTGKGSYPMVSNVLGHAHPYSGPYGGMTGGSGIVLCDGIKMVEQASYAGFREARIQHRMNTDRMPDVLYDEDGTPSTVEEWVVQLAGGLDYVPFWHYQLPKIDDNEPFGVSTAPTFQQDWVKSQGLEAPHLAELFKYASIDYQHLVRYTANAKSLAWAANDSLAKDDLQMQAEVFALSYHPYYSSAYQHVQGTTLRADQIYVEEHGPVGFDFGRGEGWGLDAAVAAYAIGKPAWRAKKIEWLNAIADVVADGQSACSGFIQSNVSPKFLDGKYRGRQIIEQSIIENALVGLVETVFRNKDVARTALLDDVITDSTYSMLDEMAWGPGEKAPWGIAAVGPLNDSLPPWCNVVEVPLDGHSLYVDGFQNWSSFAYGYERTGDEIFLQFAATQQETTDLLPSMLQDGLDNMENRAALLALLQDMQGTL